MVPNFIHLIMPKRKLQYVGHMNMIFHFKPS